MENVKTIGEFLDFLIETNNNSKSDFFFDYAGHVNAVTLYGYLDGWIEDTSPACYKDTYTLSYLKNIPELIKEMIAWVEKVQIPKEPEVEHV